MTQLLKSRAALYAGTWFRSRLEATWAAYFQAHQIQWKYEEHAFQFADGTRYMPDFWLPDSRVWFEAKGKCSEEDAAKILLLAKESDPKHELVILGGSPAGMVFGHVSPHAELNQELPSFVAPTAIHGRSVSRSAASVASPISSGAPSSITASPCTTAARAARERSCGTRTAAR